MTAKFHDHYSILPSFEAFDASEGRKPRSSAVRFPIIPSTLCFSLLLGVGCVTTPGARPSVWPTKTVGDQTSIGGSPLSESDSIGSKISSTAKGVKGQFASVGTAVSSAYGKAKKTVSSAFTATPNEPVDQTTLAVNGNEGSLGPEMHVITGHMYEQNGNYTKAMDYYSKALESEPNNLSALTSMARLHDRQNNGSKAVEFYQKAVNLAPNQAPLHAELGDVEARMGQVASAKEQYQKAINLDPKNRSYRSNLAGLLIDEGQAEQAVQELGQVDAPAMAQYQMAYLYMSRQNYAAARQYLGNALNIDPNLQPARDMLTSLSAGSAVQQAGLYAQQANQLYQQGGQFLQQTSQALGTVPAMTASATRPVP